MIIDRETFTELAVHLKLASDAILKTARHLAVLSNGDSGSEEHWAGTLDSLMSMNTEITVMERILRALMEANREEEGLPVSVPDKKSEPLPSLGSSPRHLPPAETGRPHPSPPLLLHPTPPGVRA
jgi:hypothetical protein